MATAIAQTPARPLPGVWPQTPAVRPGIPAPSFQSPAPSSSRASILPQSTSSTSLTTTRPAEPPAQTSVRQPESLEPVERAARAINDALTNESRFPEVDGYLSQGYSAEYDHQQNPTYAPFQKAGQYPIPDEIFEQYNNAQLSTSMGLFAELRHAWTTIDNALYMWDFTMSTS